MLRDLVPRARYGRAVHHLALGRSRGPACICAGIGWLWGEGRRPCFERGGAVAWGIGAVRYDEWSEGFDLVAAKAEAQDGRFGDPAVNSQRDRRAFRVALVNIMPDSAFNDTHRRFTDLIRTGSSGLDLEIRCYWLPEMSCQRSTVVRGAPYQDVACLYRDVPDALLVTGTEPVSSELTAEKFWGSLANLVRWATTTVPSTLMSCLAAHAALRAIDDVERLPLPRKRSGIFPQGVDCLHVLGQGLSSITAFPHSRWNEVPSAVLRNHGYDMVVGSEDGDWTVAAREDAGRMLVLVQGHPEYEPTALLREYRRDLRRFAQDPAASCPQLPVGYLDEEGEGLLRGWRAMIERVPASAWQRDLSLDAVANHIVPSWSASAIQLFSNWIGDARRRASLGSSVTASA